MLKKFAVLTVAAIMAGAFSIYSPATVFSAEEENLPQQEEQVAPEEQTPQEEQIAPEEQVPQEEQIGPGEQEEQQVPLEEIPQPEPDQT